MPLQRLVEIIVPDVPEEIMDALLRDAEQRDVSRNEAAVSILARRYSVRRDPSASRYKPPKDRDPARPMQLTVPEALRTRLHDQHRRGTVRGLVLEALAEEYGVPFDSPQRRQAQRV